MKNICRIVIHNIAGEYPFPRVRRARPRRTERDVKQTMALFCMYMYIECDRDVCVCIYTLICARCARSFVTPCVRCFPMGEREKS